MDDVDRFAKPPSASVTPSMENPGSQEVPIDLDSVPMEIDTVPKITVFPESPTVDHKKKTAELLKSMSVEQQQKYLFLQLEKTGCKPPNTPTKKDDDDNDKDNSVVRK